MAKYKKKPIPVEAEQWFPDKTVAGVHFENEATAEDLLCLERLLNLETEESLRGRPFVQTLEGRLYVSPGDWIMTGVEGEHWVVKPSIFEKTYEPVTE